MDAGDALHSADVSIEPAASADRSDAAQRWPGLADLPEPQEVFVVRHRRSGALSGAMAVDPYPVPFRITGRAVRLFVDDGPQADAIRLALLREAERGAANLGLQALYAGDSVPERSEQSRLWRRLGFESNPKIAHYEVVLAAYLDLLTPMYDALTVRGHVPIEARIIPLAQSPIGEVIQLQIEHIGGDAGRLETRLRGRGYYPFDPQLSRVAMMDGRVYGFLLAQVDRYRRLMVESRVVAPGHRRSWVNVAIMQEAASAALRQGFDRIRFLAGDRHQDTHRLARKAGPAMHRREVMVRRVGP